MKICPPCVYRQTGRQMEPTRWGTGYCEQCHRRQTVVAERSEYVDRFTEQPVEDKEKVE